MPPPATPPKVSDAYVAGKKRPRKPEERASIPVAALAAGVTLLLLLSAGAWVYLRVSRGKELATQVLQQAAAPRHSAEDLAIAYRRDTLAAGLVPAVIQVSIGQPPPEGGAQEVGALIAYRVPLVFGINASGTVERKFNGADLVASSYEGDGTPRVDAATDARLKQLLSTAQCPAGTTQHGDSPPKGTETWCEKPGAGGKPVRHGPFFSWHANGNSKEEGTYAEGKRHGRWTRFNADGVREAEAWYRNDVQHGRFRRWDAQGTQVMDVEYRDGVPQSR